MEPVDSTAHVPIMENSHNFLKVSHTRGFVDKSLLIETAFKHGSRLLLTAPSKFCKSTNLHMMKCFFSDRSDQAESEVFKTLDIYKRSKKFYKQHVHKYKVVFVDLTSGKSASYSDALDAYRWAIHNTFLEHDYLLKTSILETSEEKIFSSWCNMNRGYKTKQKEDMVNDLSLLVEVLARQSKNKVIVLVDEYDSIITKAIYEGQRDCEFNDIIHLTSDVLQSLLKDTTMVKLVIVSGISGIGNHEFFKYYGIQKDDFITLLARKEFAEKQHSAEDLLFMYGGYKSYDRKNEVLNLFSLLKSLKILKIQDNYRPLWKIQHHGEMITNLINSPYIARLFHQLLLVTTKRVILEVLDMGRFLHLSELRNTYSQNVKNQYSIDARTYVHHLREIGLLNIAYFEDKTCVKKRQSGRLELELPNGEVFCILSHNYQSYVTRSCNLSIKYYSRDNFDAFATNLHKSGLLELSEILNGGEC